MGKKVGFIGAGNMAKAIIGGVIKADLFNVNNIMASAKSPETLAAVAREYGICTTTDNEEVAKNSDIIFLCVKPKHFPEVIAGIKDVVSENTLIISIAAGLTLDTLAELFGKDCKLVRVMPNTPAMVGTGMAAITPNANVTAKESEIVEEIFGSLGRARVVKESEMDAVTSVSGSSPAFVYMFIEALADGAVAAGMQRKDAYEFAAQTVMGSAKMVLKTGKHPGELKDQVCSPGGTTIEGVAALEAAGFRSAVIEAVRAAAEKSKEMGKK